MSDTAFDIANAKRVTGIPTWEGRELELVKEVDTYGGLTGRYWIWIAGMWRLPIDALQFAIRIAGGALQKAAAAKTTRETATILPFKPRASLLPQPTPERIQAIYFVDHEMRIASMLSVGVHIRTVDNNGLRIVPIKEVLFAIGPDTNPERTAFSVPAPIAKYLRARLDEFIAACEEAPVAPRETTSAVLNQE